MGEAASVTAGGAQISWIAAQLAIMQRYFLLQPVMIVLGLLIIAVAIGVRRHEPLWPLRRSPPRQPRWPDESPAIDDR